MRDDKWRLVCTACLKRISDGVCAMIYIARKPERCECCDAVFVNDDRNPVWQSEIDEMRKREAKT